jgi:RimJ/RimL family protein N-acetyltransferase
LNLKIIACSALILNCLEEGLYLSWDAQNINSVRLAEKLGYEFDHEYVAYEVV